VPRVEKQNAARLKVLGVAGSISMTGRLRPADNSPHRKAIAESMGKIRSAKSVTMPSTHIASPLDATGSVRLFKATPLRSSPNVKTLRNSSSEPTADKNATTPASGRDLRVSEMTFVSRRYTCHRNSKLDGPARVSIALNREVVNLRTAQEVGLEVRAMGDKDPIVLNRQHDSASLPCRVII
jgi:hypothetical protein